MKLAAWTFAALVTLSGTAVRESLVARYPEGRTTRFSSSETSDATLGEYRVSINGQELPEEYVEAMRDGLPDQHIETEIVVVTEVLASEDGLPRKVRRTWETGTKEKTGGEAETETYSLEGRTLVLALEDDEVVVEVDDDGDELDDVDLESHRLVEDLDVLLPDDEVEVGDSWTLSDEASAIVLEFGGSPGSWGDDDDEPDMDAKMREKAVHSTEVTFDSMVELDGVQCALLTFESEVTAEFDEVPGLVPEGEEAPDATTELDFEFEGSLWFDVENGRPVRFERRSEGSMDIELDQVQESDGQEFDLNIRMERLVEGRAVATWEYED